MLEIYERIGIRGKLTGLLLVLLLVVAVNIVAVYYVQEETNEITDTIEVANKQSVLSQEIAFHSFRKAELENQGDQLQNAIVQYEQNLAVLENRTRGGETVGSVLQPGSVLGKARDELREQRRVWEEYSAKA